MINSNVSNERIPLYDEARGIAIFLVIIGHCIASIHNPINQAILSFHMPLFFVISGMLLNRKKINAKKVKFYIQKKQRHLLRPQVTLGIFECIFIMLCGLSQTHSFSMLSFGDIIHAIFRWWFLLVLFQISLISIFIRNIVLENTIRQIVFGITLACIVILQQCGIILQNKIPCFVNVVPFALMFYMIGFYAQKLFTNTKLFMLPICVFVVAILSQINEPVLMYGNQYGNFGIFLMTSLCGSYAVIGISQRVHSSFFIWLGKVSIIVYVLQFHINQYSRIGVNRILKKMTNLFNNAEMISYLGIVLTTLSSLTICIVLAYWISRSRYIKKAFGYE